jgi:hypothetical protein
METIHRAITPEELNESLARRDQPDRRPSMPARDQALMSAIGTVLVDEIEKACKPLRDRIARLEKEIEQRRYVGVWATGKYHEGNMVTLDGSIFHCNVAETTQRPGTGPDWTLAIKRGQDGRDASRGPTAQRGPASVGQR